MLELLCVLFWDERQFHRPSYSPLLYNLEVLGLSFCIISQVVHAIWSACAAIACTVTFQVLTHHTYSRRSSLESTPTILEIVGFLSRQTARGEAVEGGQEIAMGGLIITQEH